LCGIDQLIRIGNRVAVLKYRVVTCSFCLKNKTSPCDPNQRIEPISGTDDARERLNGPITTFYMFQFMDESALQILICPARGIVGKKNRRARDTAGHWSRYPWL